MSTATPKPSNGDIELAANQTAPLVAASEEPSSVVTSGGSRLDKRLVLGGLGSRLGALYSGMFHEGLTKEEENSHRTGTSSRNATMLSVFWHNFTSMVGAGILALPFAMACLGWPLGITCMILSWAISFGTFALLVELHEQHVPPSVLRMDRYHDLTKFAFGDKWGFWLLVPFQIILFVGIPIAYTITAAISLQKVVALLDAGSSWGGAGSGGLGRWIFLFMIVNLFVVQVRSFHSLSAVSAVGAVASIFYALVAFVGSLAHRARDRGVNGGAPRAHPVSYAHGAAKSQGSTNALLLDTANAIATIAFAYGGHNIAQEIQATLPFPPSTAKPMMRSVHLTFALTAFFYFSVAFSGYAVFGNAVDSNVLVTLSNPKGLMVAANLMVVLHVLAGFHVYLFPLLDMIDGAAIKRGILPSSPLYRLVVRTIMVLLVSFVAAAVPFFEVVVGFLGALSITPTTFIMPCLLWLKLRRPGPREWQFWFCWLTLPVMTAVMFIGAAGAVRQFIDEVVKDREGAKSFSS